MLIQLNELIGKHIIYFDYLGIESYGIIAGVEPCNEEDQVYVYIEDEDIGDNIHEDIINGKNIRYAEIRLSTEIYLDDAKVK